MPLPIGKPRPHPATDWENARRLVERHGGSLLYCRPWRKWLVWDGCRWRVDETGEVERLAKSTAGQIYLEVMEAFSSGDAKGGRELAGWAKASQSEARVRAMVKLAETEPEVVAEPKDFDQQRLLLTVLNGTLDLQTGELRPHRPDDLITKLAPVEYDPEAACPAWEGFLTKIMDGDGNLIAFLQRAVGYSLTGDITERVLFFLLGDGANGKTTFLEAIRSMLGDYARTTPAETLLVKRSGGIPSDVARLQASRFVSASESEKGKYLAEAQVKQLTGGDTIAARFMYGEWFEFPPQFKLWLATNNKPLIRGTDKAIWDRIVLIPFQVRIPEEKQDKKLPAKLHAELAGIMAWAVRGCLEWQKAGLDAPEAVCKATGAYQEEMDPLHDFLEECCVLEPTAWVLSASLRTAYEAWAIESSEPHLLSGKDLSDALKARGLVSERLHAGRGWRGIKLAVTP